MMCALTLVPCVAGALRCDVLVRVRQVMVSCFEVYNETIIDLLDESPRDSLGRSSKVGASRTKGLNHACGAAA